MFAKRSQSNLTSVETLQKQVSTSISLFSTIRQGLKNAQEKLTQQIGLRDEQITKLCEERSTLNDLYTQSGSVIEKIDQILS